MGYRKGRNQTNPVAARRRTLTIQWVVAVAAVLLTGYLVVRALLMA